MIVKVDVFKVQTVSHGSMGPNLIVFFTGKLFFAALTVLMRVNVLRRNFALTLTLCMEVLSPLTG